jgi:hypothetical protein
VQDKLRDASAPPPLHSSLVPNIPWTIDLMAQTYIDTELMSTRTKKTKEGVA